jgi:hypothetical protein
LRDVYCLGPAVNGGAFSWAAATGQALVNGSLSYSDQLIVVAVSLGSVWSLTLSDVPNVRTADVRVPASDRRAALERAMRPVQLGGRRA